MRFFKWTRLTGRRDEYDVDLSYLILFVEDAIEGPPIGDTLNVDSSRIACSTWDLSSLHAQL